MKRKGVIVTFTFLLLVAAIAGAFCYFFLPNNKVVPAFEEDKLNLVVDGEVVESEELPRVVDEEILLPMDVIKKYFDPNIFWDDQLKKVTITTKDRVVRMKTESLDAFVNNKPVTLKIPVTEQKKGEEKITLQGNKKHGTKHNEYVCYECGYKNDRDENAVLNLLALAK